jgi:hypothetical protein
MLKLAPLVLAALLAGCGTTGRIAQSLDTTPNSGPCPVVGSVYDAARYVKFATPEGKIYSDIAFTGEIADVRMYCRYTGDVPLVAEVERRLQAGVPDVLDTLARDFEAAVIRTALRHTHGRRIDAATRLGVGRNTITRKIQELGLPD